MNKMSDKEIVLASEDVQRRNIQSCVDHSNETRKIMRKLQENITRMNNNFLTLSQRVDDLTKQLSMIQAKLYAGGT